LRFLINCVHLSKKETVEEVDINTDFYSNVSFCAVSG
jgi:hypothetical protein